MWFNRLASPPQPIAPFVARCVAFFLAGHCALAGAAQVFNTGVGASGVPLGVGTSDPHWSVIAGPGVTAPVPAIASSVYVEFPTRPDSAWIWASVSAAGINSPYTFRTTFVLTPAEAAALQLSGSWSVDNVGRIELNGAAPGGSGSLALGVSLASNYQTFHDFTITSGFVAGNNTLDFIATDFGGVAGLNVGGLTISPVPEPASGLLMLAGLMTGVLCTRRRQPGGRAAAATAGALRQLASCRAG